MLKLFTAIIAVALVSNVVCAQDVFQPAVQPQIDPGRYNAKGERLSTRSPKHVLANADKTHFTWVQWAQKIEEAKTKKDKVQIANFIIEFVRVNTFARHPEDLEDLRTAVLILNSSDDEIARAASVDIVFRRFRDEFTDLLIASSKDPSPEVKWRAFRALGRRQVRGLTPVLGDALNGRKEAMPVRLQAARSLILKLEHGEEDALPPLKEGLKTNKDPEIRKEIEEALAKHYARTN